MALTIRAVLFDLDNTLYDRDRTFEQCVPGFVEEHFAALEDSREMGSLTADAYSWHQWRSRSRSSVHGDP